MAIPFLKSKVRAARRQDDALALFDTEGTSPAAASPLPDGPGASVPESQADVSDAAIHSSDGITLEMVLERGTFVSWQEAVAILEGTCAALVPVEGSELPAPNPSEIMLTADGRVEVQTGGFGFGRGDSVQRLARALHVLTTGQTIPAPLRLFISKWIASEGKHPVAEFAKELAYFARPDGADLIRQVYQRYLSTPAAARPTPEKKAETQQRKAEKKQQPASGKRRRGALLAAAAAFLMAAAVTVAFYRPAQGGQGGSDLLATLMARASEFARSLGEVRTQIGNLSTQLSEHLAAGDKPPAAEPAPAPAPAAGRPRTAPRSASAGVTASVPGISAIPTISEPPSGVVVDAASAESAALDLAGAAAASPESAAPAPAVVPDPDAIYSTEDAGVEPPKMVYPQLPPPALVLGSSAVNVMEIIIGQDGRVEKVRLVSPPRRMTDMMLLSGAKLWRFDPASVDGQPVKYRMAVSWSPPVP